MKPLPREVRIQLHEDLEAGRVTLADAIRRARRAVGLSQTELARLAGVAPRALMDFERGVGNPTLTTLRKLAAPFGLVLCLRPRSAMEDPEGYDAAR